MLNFFKNIGILLLNILFSIFIFAITTLIFVFSGVLKNNNFETKMIIADIVFILVWILYLIIKVILKKIKTIEIFYILAVLIFSIYSVVFYFYDNKEKVFESNHKSESIAKQNKVTNAEKLNLEIEVYYNKNMKIEKKINNKYKYLVQYIYDNNGKIISTKQLGLDGRFISEERNYYNNKNKIEKIIEESVVTGKFMQKFLYNSNGNLIKKEKYNLNFSETIPVIYEEYENDYENRVISQKEYNYNVNKKIYFVFSSKKFAYDSNDKIIEEIEENVLNAKTKKTIREYVEDNLVLERKFSDSQEIGKILYKYDKKNRIVSEENYYDDKLSEKILYKNIYY